MVYQYCNLIVADTQAELVPPTGASGYCKLAVALDTQKFLYVSGGAWVEISVEGPAGPQGDPGADGNDGAAGADGITTLRAVKTSDQTNIGTAFVDVSGLGLALLANKTYVFEFTVFADADATTTGIDIAVNGPASPTSIRYEQIYWTSATVRTERAATAYDANTASTASNGTAVKPFYVKGVIQNGGNAGTLIPRLKREAVGSGPNARAGSYGIAWQLD